MGRRLMGLAVTTTIAGTLALACGSGPGSGSEYDMRSPPYTGEVLPPEDPRWLDVPPDRAAIPVNVVEFEETFAASAASLRAQVDGLTSALPEGCTVRVVTYESPARGGWDDLWRSRTELAVDVAFTETKDVRERMDRLDACTAVVDARLVRASSRGSSNVDSLTSNVPTFEVDDPEKHLAALADAAVRQQQAAAAITGAPQLHAEDWRCVPTGRVVVGQRSIAAVQVQLEMPCRLAPGGEPPPAG